MVEVVFHIRDGIEPLTIPGMNRQGEIPWGWGLPRDAAAIVARDADRWRSTSLLTGRMEPQ